MQQITKRFVVKNGKNSDSERAQNKIYKAFKLTMQYGYMNLQNGSTGPVARCIFAKARF